MSYEIISSRHIMNFYYLYVWWLSPTLGKCISERENRQIFLKPVLFFFSLWYIQHAQWLESLLFSGNVLSLWSVRNGSCLTNLLRQYTYWKAINQMRQAEVKIMTALEFREKWHHCGLLVHSASKNPALKDGKKWAAVGEGKSKRMMRWENSGGNQRLHSSYFVTHGCYS